MKTMVAPIPWQADYQTALARAKDEKRGLLVYFHKPN